MNLAEVLETEVWTAQEDFLKESLNRAQKTLVLGSTSPYRKAQMQSLLIPFICESPRIDEDNEKKLRLHLSPERLAWELAEKKAESLSSLGKVIVGADQLVSFEGEILGKPGDFSRALQQLQRLQGKTHDLLTAVCVNDEGRNQTWICRAQMAMRPLSDHQIRRYLEIDQSFDCAGSYKIEKHGISLMASILTEDFTSIQGLPLIQLSKVLHNLGYEIPQAQATL